MEDDGSVRVIVILEIGGCPPVRPAGHELLSSNTHYPARLFSDVGVYPRFEVEPERGRKEAVELGLRDDEAAGSLTFIEAEIQIDFDQANRRCTVGALGVDGFLDSDDRLALGLAPEPAWCH